MRTISTLRTGGRSRLFTRNLRLTTRRFFTTMMSSSLSRVRMPITSSRSTAITPLTKCSLSGKTPFNAGAFLLIRILSVPACSPSTALISKRTHGAGVWAIFTGISPARRQRFSLMAPRTTTPTAIAAGLWNLLFPGKAWRNWPGETTGHCHPGMVTCGEWTSPASTNTRKPRPPKTPAVGFGAVMGFGIHTFQNVFLTSSSRPTTLAGRPRPPHYPTTRKRFSK